MKFSSEIITSTIPYGKSYGITLMTLLSLSSFSLAKNIYSRFSQTQISIITINLWVKGMIVLLGLFILPINLIFNASTTIQLFSIVLGLLLGYLYVETEKYIVRFFTRRSQSKSIIYQKNSNNLGLNVKSLSLGLSSNQVKKTNFRIDKKNKNITEKNILKGNFSALVLLAIFEEIIYRGYLTIIIGFIPFYFLQAGCLLIIAILFAFIHAPYSLPQMTAKFILSLSALTSFLILGTLTTAIVMHIYLNVAVYFYNKKYAAIDRQYFAI